MKWDCFQETIRITFIWIWIFEKYFSESESLSSSSEISMSSRMYLLFFISFFYVFAFFQKYLWVIRRNASGILKTAKITTTDTHTRWKPSFGIFVHAHVHVTFTSFYSLYLHWMKEVHFGKNETFVSQFQHNQIFRILWLSYFHTDFFLFAKM